MSRFFRHGRDRRRAHSVYKLKKKYIVSIATIANQLNISFNLLNRMLVIASKVPCYTEKSWITPLYNTCLSIPKFFFNKPLKFLLVIH